jgi:hypothetical protein
VLKKHRGLAKAHPLGVDADVASDLPHSKPAWVGLRELEDDRKVYGLEELQGGYGLRLFEWDGRWAHLLPQWPINQLHAEPPTQSWTPKAA